MKKVAIVAAVMLLMGSASAQEKEAGKKDWNLRIEFSDGMNVLGGSKGFAEYMHTYNPGLDYRGKSGTAVQLGFAFSVEYRRLALGLHCDGMEGFSNRVTNQYVKKEDGQYFLDLGYRFDVGLGLTLEPTAGFGIGISEIYLATSRSGADYVNSFSTACFIVPLTLNLMSGHCGIFVQYSIDAGQIGKAHITGLETEVDNLRFRPATLTFGTKVRF
ncbi:MAG: hypothetical protein J6X79_06485 [Bacteroidales bacterium]|nr:hypothetical protein [Bacteroidales bacterium]